MKVQFGFQVAYPVLIIFGVMASKESEETLPLDPMNISSLPVDLVLTQDHDRRFDRRSLKGRGLSHETLDQKRMVLTEHTRHNIPFGGEFFQFKIVFGSKNL